MALSAQNKKQYRIAVEYFKQCILVNFNLKQCYLYICGYYGENPQEKINKYNLEAGFKEFEDRNFFFNYYYAKYQQIKEEDFFIVNLSSYQKLKNRVEQIKKEME